MKPILAQIFVKSSQDSSKLPSVPTNRSKAKISTKVAAQAFGQAKLLMLLLSRQAFSTQQQAPILIQACQDGLLLQKVVPRDKPLF